MSLNSLTLHLLLKSIPKFSNSNKILNRSPFSTIYDILQNISNPYKFFMEELEIPSHFLCPISLQIMKDPVTLSSGITYDRENIEKWLFSCKKNICPMTKHVLFDSNLTPNHTLRRLIQSWCILNADSGIERIPTPKTPIDKTLIVKLINDAKRCPYLKIECLRKIKSMASESESNKRCLESAGVVEFLGSILMEEGCEEALSILYIMNPSEICLKKLMNDNGEFLNGLLGILKSDDYYQSRGYAIMVLKSVIAVSDPIHLINLKQEVFVEIVRVLRDQISQQSTKAALKLLMEICPWGRNRIKAVESGACLVLIEILLNTYDKRVVELTLIVLDQLCGCAEGRSELLNHGGGLAVVSKKILRVSHAASDRAVRILSSISRFSANDRVLQEMLNVGVVSKLCLVIQLNGGLKTKERARAILKSHARVWKNSSCIPLHLLSSYPSS